ncbi:MAG TPA: GrpB family protein [Ktedonobacterales bacterium]|nr:GrpB family protein [Ktedonobacterales bacterium]
MADDADTTADEPAASERTETTEESLRAIHVQPLVPLNGPVYLAEYDLEWPRLYAREAERIRAALGDRVRLLEHAGSTAVPGLAAKPRIDIVLAVPDSAAEAAYLPPLEAAGYVLAIREPEWFEHRVCKGPDTDVNLHIFSAGCPEIARMLRFRDWLRTHDDDRQLYEATKRELAQRTWHYTQHYADAKSEVVRAILARAESGEAQSQQLDRETQAASD